MSKFKVGNSRKTEKTNSERNGFWATALKDLKMQRMMRRIEEGGWEGL